MRLLATASCLFLSAVALQHCRQAPVAEAPGSGSSTGNALKAVATPGQLMDAIIVPNAQGIWDAVIYENGTLVTAPKTDDDWYSLQMKALAVAEAGNLLKIGQRAKDTGDWMTFSTALTDRSMEAARAAERKDLDGVIAAGGNMYNVCTDCHRQYVMPDAP